MSVDPVAVEVDPYMRCEYPALDPTVPTPTPGAAPAAPVPAVLLPMTGVCDRSKVNSMVLPGSSFFGYRSVSAKLEPPDDSQWYEGMEEPCEDEASEDDWPPAEAAEADDDGGATNAELRVTASFRIFIASFQC